MPVNGQFLFGDYLEADVVIFEEFSWERFKFNLPQIKRVLERKPFSVDVKCSCKKDTEVSCYFSIERGADYGQGVCAAVTGGSCEGEVLAVCEVLGSGG
jgi:hypothetical protein